MGTLTINGIGKKRAMPDIATIAATIRVTEDTTQKSLCNANEKMASLIQVLDNLAIHEKDRQTTQFYVKPKHRRGTEGELREIIGWTTCNALSITVRDIAKIGELLSATGQHGEVDGMHFSNSQADALLDEARQLAVKDAIRKAKLYCEAAGVTLKKIIEINEQQNYYASYGREAIVMAACNTGNNSAPIETGEQTVSISVHTVFEITGDVATKAEDAT
jgi:uncharacterized protein